MIPLTQLVSALENLLEPAAFSDYCPNGLQVEGKSSVKKIVSGVTASQSLIDAAIARQADAILVHHGYFWKGEDAPLVGIKGARIKALMQNDISLLAYHLPLDVHKSLGNNAQLAKLLGLQVEAGLEINNSRSVGLIGSWDQTMTAEEVQKLLNEKLGRQALHIAGGPAEIKRIAWCTGAAQSYIDLAADAGVDAYISGEISEPTVHTARERGLHYFAAGHHATERGGVKAVGEWIQQQFKIDVEFIDIDNPV